MTKKLIQTIEGATENTVVYLDDNGAAVSVSRPKIISLDTILSEIGFDVPEKKKRAKKGSGKAAEPEKESPKPDNIANKASDALSDAPKTEEGENIQPNANGSQKGK